MKTVDMPDMKDEQQPDRLTSADAATKLRVSAETLRAYVLTGQIVPITPNGRGRGKRLYFDPEEIKVFALRGAEAARKYREQRDTGNQPINGD